MSHDEGSASGMFLTQTPHSTYLYNLGALTGVLAFLRILRCLARQATVLASRAFSQH